LEQKFQSPQAPLSHFTTASRRDGTNEANARIKLMIVSITRHKEETLKALLTSLGKNQLLLQVESTCPGLLLYTPTSKKQVKT
jgi:hypothetical protein